MSDPVITQPVRILLVDDHPIVISGCRAMLTAEMACDLIPAATMEAGEELARSERPDLFIIDLNLAGGSGFALCRQLLGDDPERRIIVFSMNDDPVFAARAIDLGVMGYVSKAGDPADLLRAVREVMAGGLFLPDAIARSLAFSRRSTGANFLSVLTSREVDIFRHLGQGRSLAEIAPQVGSSYKTVANTCTAMKRKLGVRTSSELVRLAVENKLAVS